MNGKQFLEMLARLPARVWLQAILGLIGFVVLAVLGFAVIAGVAAVVLVAILLFKARQWIVGLWTRWAALANIPVLLVAMLLLHIDQGFFMKAIVADAAANRPRVVGIEYPLLVLAATFSLVLLGGGALAMTDDDRS